jgi:hypothetical protein
MIEHFRSTLLVVDPCVPYQGVFMLKTIALSAIELAEVPRHVCLVVTIFSITGPVLAPTSLPIREVKVAQSADFADASGPFAA